MIDIDFFKAINDRFGHEIGDRAIVHVANLARDCKRTTDVLARIGGEEFALLLPETDIADAHTVAERLRCEGAGVGWAPGTIGQVSLGIDMESPAGYAFQTGQMVISNHLLEETRFRTPRLLSDHGIKRAINVPIARGGEGNLPFGVLEVDSADPASSMLRMPTSLPASLVCSVLPSSGNMPTRTLRKHSTTRPC